MHDVLCLLPAHDETSSTAYHRLPAFVKRSGWIVGREVIRILNMTLGDVECSWPKKLVSRNSPKASELRRKMNSRNLGHAPTFENPEIRAPWPRAAVLRPSTRSASQASSLRMLNSATESSSFLRTFPVEEHDIFQSVAPDSPSI